MSGDEGGSLYNRYRPQGFDDLVGQDHVARALANALRSGSPARAYLFSGPRGTGKTTSARILARCLNCLSATGPTPEPCGTCESCLRTGHDDWLDVVEVDAASSARRIDEMRDWLESVRYPPAVCRYRVTIMDEAHQIQKDAASALLKTLEEPPPHLVVILCTTHPWDILPTIRSRLQHYVLRRPTVPDLTKVLERVALAEGIETSGQALDIVARAADGSYRDALGLLEQVSTYAGGRVEVTDALELIGAVSRETTFELIELVAGGQAGEAIELLESTLDAGTDPEQLMRGLLTHLRFIGLLQLGAEPRDAWGLAPDEVGRLQAEANQLSSEAVVRALDLLVEAQVRIKHGTADPRLQLELVAAKMGRPVLDPTTHGLAARIAALEQSGPAPPSPAPAPTAHAPMPPAPGPEQRSTPSPDPSEEGIQEGGSPESADGDSAGGGSEWPAPPPSDDRGEAPDLDHLERLWPGVLTQLERSAPPTRGFLDDSRLVAANGREVQVGVPSAMRADLLTTREHRERVEEALAQATGARLVLEFIPVESTEPDDEAPESPDEHEQMLRERMRQLFEIENEGQA